MKSKTRKGILAGAVIAVAYAVSAGAARLVEQWQLYLPGTPRALVAPRDTLALPIKRVEILTRDSVTLVGWAIVGIRMPSIDSTVWMLICHGSGGNIATPKRLQYYATLRKLGLNILAFDYRGYGESTGKPSEDGLYRDADAAYRYLRDTRGVPASRIIPFGHSLGSGVAIDLAAHVPVGGLIVEGAFTSLVDVERKLYPWVPIPIRWLPLSRFPSIDKVDRIRAPKLFLHATADKKIPIAQGHHLYAKAVPPKRFVELRGGHSDAFEVDSVKYFESISRFASEVAKLDLQYADTGRGSRSNATARATSSTTESQLHSH